MTNHTTSHTQQFGNYLLEHIDQDLQEVTAQVAQCGENFARAAEEGDLTMPVRDTLEAVSQSIAQNDTDILIEYGKHLGLRRAGIGFSVRELIRASDIVREHVWRRLYLYMADHGTWPPDQVRRVEDFIHVFTEHYVSSVNEALIEARHALAEQSRQLEAQQALIRELGAPIMPVFDGVLVLPLVGAIDSHRAMQVMENLLEAITSYQSDIVIVDITGVPMVDTSVANYILQAARAANLVGAHIVLVGIGATIAQTIVQLGVDMSSITTLANLQEGIAYASEHRARAAARKQAAARAAARPTAAAVPAE